MDWEGIGAGGWGGGRRLVGTTLKTRLRSSDFSMSETGSKDSVSSFLSFQDNDRWVVFESLSG